MKKRFAVLFVGVVLILVSCQEKPKTEESSANTTATTVMPADTLSITADSIDTESNPLIDTTGIPAPIESLTN